MTKKSAARRKIQFGAMVIEKEIVAKGVPDGPSAAVTGRKSGIFGTLFQPVARWWCSLCGQANASRLMVPIRSKEFVPCKGCHRMTTLTVEVDKLPQCWGGPVVDDGAPKADVVATPAEKASASETAA